MRKPPPQIEAFTLVEILVAAAIGAAVITAAVIGFGVISQSPLRQGVVNVVLPAGTVSNLYGVNTNFITLGANPNYFQAAQARRMKDRLVSDAVAASAVFCLGRNAQGTAATRTHELSVSSPRDFRTQATPRGFRDFLVELNGDVEDIFPEDQGGAQLATTNASLFIVGTLSNILNYSNTLTILATYEVDFVPTIDPPGGTMASVRRYSGTNTSVPTDYYHVYYPEETNGTNGFRPLSAFFGRAAADPNGDDPFATATNNPFTFLWWPDPLVSKLEAGTVPAPSSDSPRANYSNMAERTSLFFVLPAFPSL